MYTYLLKRKNGAFYFRRAIPIELRPLFGGRREWVFSLKTKTRSEAKRSVAVHALATEDALTKAKGLPLDHSASELYSIKHDRLEPKPDDVKYALQLPVRLNRTVGKTEKSSSENLSLLEIFEGYSAEQGLKKGTTDEWRSIIQGFQSYIGHCNAVSISFDDVSRWRDHLLNSTTRTGRKLSPRTVRGKHICALKATLSWAVEKRKLSHNAAKGIVVRVPAKHILRNRDFTLSEARAILKASLQPLPGKGSHTQALAQRWLPWLAAYTGARINELTQLRTNDVYQVDGIWIIRITPEAGTVKDNAVRLVPLHSDLVNQGIVTALKSVDAGPIFYSLTNDKTVVMNSRPYKKVGERLAEWVRQEVGLTDPDLQPNHAWRHLFKTLMVEAGVSERVANAIQGHTARSVGQTYGSVSVRTMVEAINLIPRFDVV